MAIWICGSINIDNIYHMPRLPKPGETLASTDLSVELGGKGANQSVAVACGGSEAYHIGAIGDDAPWVSKELQSLRVKIDHVHIVSAQTGHANIYVDGDGENQIVLFSGANATISNGMVTSALDVAEPSDLVLVQNETNIATEAIRYAHQLGLKILYSAAPFDLNIVRDCIGLVDLLLVNEVEIEQLEAALGTDRKALPPKAVIVTKGAHGVDLYRGDQKQSFKAISANVVDTTGAGDCFAGYLAVGLDQGLTLANSIKLAVAAASLQVETKGTAKAIPMRSDVDVRLKRG